MEPRASMSRRTLRIIGGFKSAIGNFPMAGKTSRSRLRMTSSAWKDAHCDLNISCHSFAIFLNVHSAALRFASMVSFFTIARKSVGEGKGVVVWIDIGGGSHLKKQKIKTIKKK